MTEYIPYREFDGITLYQGDVREILRGLPDGSIDCVLTSPPYWGLRDYGTGTWEGGDPDCEHDRGGMGQVPQTKHGAAADVIAAGGNRGAGTVCVKCDAVLVDRQIGLEDTPSEYVAALGQVFDECHRLLAPHGTAWVNLGDSYVADHAQRRSTVDEKGRSVNTGIHASIDGSKAGELRGPVAGLKPKDLTGIPWRVAFALQDAGWWLRSEIVWAKGVSFCPTYSGSAMPEAVRDRPSKAHETVFLLSKARSYFYDQEAVREPHTSTRWGGDTITQPDTSKYAEFTDADGAAGALSRPGREWNAYPEGGRNLRSVWTIGVEPFPGAHFAVMPSKLAETAIALGCPARVCRTCGKPSERVVEKDGESQAEREARLTGKGRETIADRSDGGARGYCGSILARPREIKGETWTDCGHEDWRPGVVLDPFFGAGTTALAARRLNRECVGVELSREFCDLALRRLLDPDAINRAAVAADRDAQLALDA